MADTFSAIWVYQVVRRSNGWLVRVSPGGHLTFEGQDDADPDAAVVKAIQENLPGLEAKVLMTAVDQDRYGLVGIRWATKVKEHTGS